MPPKRKNKASKAATTTPVKATPAELAHAKRSNSLQGGKTSRLPSIALHMTTRQAAKTASNHTSSAAPSLASSDSRRASLNSILQFEDAQSETEDAVKRPRLSTDSGSPQPSATSTIDQTLVNGTQTPELQNPPSNPVSNGSKTSTKKRRVSDEAKKTITARPNGARTETVSEVQPPRKKRKTTTKPLAEPAEPADLPPELTDASTAPNSPEQLVEVDSSQNLHHVLPTNGDAPAKMGRRLPGRRRAPHPNINIETDLRRQLNLKMNYRTLAKVQKTILEELSSRTTNNLKNDPEYYKQVPAYKPLMAALDQRKADRIAQVDALRREKLDQLERVRIATEHIEREKYIQRFQELQEDLLLQCYYRMKQIDREAKGQEAAATDDEDNVVHATRMKFPTIDDDDRLGSKFASRSRAYVETEKSLNEDIYRKRLGQLREAFVAKDDDADDLIEDVPTGFAAFNGPDRTEAVVHRNIMDLIDACADVENAPAPPLLVPHKVIPNEQADALFLLASLSADAPREAPRQEEPDEPEQATLPADQVQEPSSMDAPVAEENIPSALENMPSIEDLPMESANVPSETAEVQAISRYSTPVLQTNGTLPAKELQVPKTETPARSTHRIMDMLNADVEVPTTKVRESQPSGNDHTPVATPSRRVNVNNGPSPFGNGTVGPEPVIHRQEPPSAQMSLDAQTQPLSQAAPWSPVSRIAPSWPSRTSNYMSGMSEESLRKRDPLNTIRAMLDAKAISEGRIPANQRSDRPEHIHKAPVERERASDSVAPPAQPLSASAPQENPESYGEDTVMLDDDVAYSPSPPPAPPLSYHQSPSVQPAYPPPRSVSHDRASSQWGDRRLSGSQASRDRRTSGSQAPRDRRMSGSQVPPPPSASPYAVSLPELYHSEASRTSSHQAHRQSPYASAQQLPSLGASLPQKPPGPPPSAHINFRFAHYDPAPSRAPYPPQQTAAGYGPPAPHLPPYATGSPATQHHAPAYGVEPPSYQRGYIPPPGSFQAPPPPPPNGSVYPQLKIQQYGGQTILPANMAPPPPHPRPSVSFVSQSSPPTIYTAPQQHQISIQNRTPAYEYVQSGGGSQDPAAAEQHPAHSSDGSSRNRRAYRSYHAPGTQFRSYQGPETGRRRGG